MEKEKVHRHRAQELDHESLTPQIIEDKCVRLGGRGRGEVYLYRGRIAGRMRDIALKRFTRFNRAGKPLTDAQAQMYCDVIGEVEEALSYTGKDGKRRSLLPKTEMVKLSKGTEVAGDTLAEDEWVQMQEPYSIRGRTKFMYRLNNPDIPAHVRKKAIMIFTKIANLGYPDFLDVVEPLHLADQYSGLKDYEIIGKEGTRWDAVPFDLDRLVEADKAPPEECAKTLVKAIDWLSGIESTKDERKGLIETAYEHANPELAAALKKELGKMGVFHDKT